MKKAELMQEKITQQRKLPKDKKQKIIRIAFTNLLISIALVIYLIVVDMLYLNLEMTLFTNIVKGSAIILILIDIIIFETGYRKDNISIWIYAFEILIFSVLALLIPYINIYETIKRIIILVPITVSIYYIIKVILIYFIELKKYQNNLSDVKELLKDNEEYLDD